MPRISARKRLNQRKKPTISTKPSRSRRSEKPRRQWTNVQMEAAMKAVEDGSPINQAARDHGVPKTTLRDRLSGRVIHGSKPGPKPYLSSSEELELSSFIKESAKVGYGKTRKDVMIIAERVAKDKGTLRKERISQGWWNRFMERQKDLSLRRGESISHVRMDAVNKETMDHYFLLLKDTLDEHNLRDKPEQIYNVDESGLPLDPKAPNIITEKGSKNVRYRQSGRKGQVTIVACSNAVGQTIPPMVIFDAKNLNHAWTKNEVPGTKYGLSDNGWINTGLFESWVCELFIHNAVPGRPLLLLLDGHSTHYQPDVVKFAREHNIIMLCLSPHTSHASQPLDCGVFKPLKSEWTNVCHTFFQNNPGKIITRFNFNSLFSQAWLTAVNPANIIGGFKRSGVCPYDPTAVCITGSRSDVQIQSSPGDSTGSDSSFSVGDNSSNQAKGLDGSDGANVDETTNNTDHLADGGGHDPNESHPLVDSFTPKQLELFQQRFEEGYNIFHDKDYVCWLKHYHPEAVTNHSESDSYSPDVSSSEKSSSITPKTPQLTQSQSTSSTPLGNSAGMHKESCVSKYLATPCSSSASSKSAPKARLLTSADALAILEEKERKKKEAAEEKERRKKEREEKKKQKEQEREEQKKQRETEKKKENSKEDRKGQIYGIKINRKPTQTDFQTKTT